MPETHGTKNNGAPLTDEMVEAMADEAEAGYDVDELRRRQSTSDVERGTAPSTVGSVALDADLKRDLLLRAARDHVSVSALIQRALREYVKAS